MIDLTMEDFILWMISVPMVIVGLFTFLSLLKRRAAKKLTRRHIVNCRICGNLYVDRTREFSPSCPECGRANERGRSKKFG